MLFHAIIEVGAAVPKSTTPKNLLQGGLGFPSFLMNRTAETAIKRLLSLKKSVYYGETFACHGDVVRNRFKIHQITDAVRRLFSLSV